MCVCVYVTGNYIACMTCSMRNAKRPVPRECQTSTYRTRCSVKLQKSSDVPSKDLPHSCWLPSLLLETVPHIHMFILVFLFPFQLIKLTTVFFPFISYIPVLSVWIRGVLSKFLEFLLICFYYQMYTFTQAS